MSFRMDSFWGSFLSFITLNEHLLLSDYTSFIIKTVALGSVVALFPSSNILLNLTVSLLISSNNYLIRSLSSVIFSFILDFRFLKSFSSGELVLLSQLTSQLLLSCHQRGWPSFFFLLNLFPILLFLKQKKSNSLIPAGSWFVLSASLALNKWIINDFIVCIQSNFFLIAYWMFVLTITLLLPLIFPFSNQNSLRKFYHFAAVSLFVPAAICSSPLLKIALAVALTLFIYIETLRHDLSSKSKYAASLNLFMERCRNDLDRGEMVLSHIYLLLGCALPFWLNTASNLDLSCFSGVISLGIGDSLASIAGKRFGNHRWHRNTRKTFEGSLCGCLGMFWSWILINGFCEVKATWHKLLVISIGSAVWEALINLNDNLTLPLFTFTLIKAL